MPAYLKYGDKIKGEVTETGHVDWIKLSSCQFGTGRPIGSRLGTSKSPETGSVSASELVVTKEMDIASQQLFNESICGKGVEAQVDLCQAGSDDSLQIYLTLTMSDCLISGYSMSSGGDKPSESLSLNYSKIMYKYTPYDKDNKAGNPMTSGYDATTAKAVK